MGQAEHRPKAWLHRCAVAEVTVTTLSLAAIDLLQTTHRTSSTSGVAGLNVSAMYLRVN